jgi:hypothetical protein
MKKRVARLKTAERVRRVEADTDRVAKCISEFGRLKASRFSRELPIQSGGLIELTKVCPATDI